jgi:hypothetical protein
MPGAPATINNIKFDMSWVPMGDQGRHHQSETPLREVITARGKLINY